MLYQSPPDWELAKKHGKASLAYQSSKCLDIYDTERDDFCHCCKRHIPSKDELYSLNDNLILGELGEGFPIVFQLMKYLNYILLGQMIFYFVPAIVLITSAVNKYGEDTSDLDTLGLYSFGALVIYTDPDNLLLFDDRHYYIIGYCFGITAGLIISFFCIKFIQMQLNQDVKTLDQLAHTPSDFALICSCPYFRSDCDYSPKSIEEQVRNHLKLNHGISELEYVTATYDIANIFELYEKKWLLTKKRETVECFCKERGWTREEYAKNSCKFKRTERFPVDEGRGCLPLGQCCRKKAVDLENVEKEI